MGNSIERSRSLVPSLLIASSIIEIIHLPAQSGKTRKMTELMNRWALEKYDGKQDKNEVNVVFTANTKILNKQTGRRVEQDTIKKEEVEEVEEVEEEDEEGEEVIESESVGDVEMPCNTYSWIGSTPVSEIISMIILDDITNIICCSNKTRYKKVAELIQKLHKKRNCYTIKIWIDEADKDIFLWVKYLEQYLYRGETNEEEPFISSIVLISATIKSVIDKLHSKGVNPSLRVYENTHSENYLTFSMCKKNTTLVENGMASYHGAVRQLLTKMQSCTGSNEIIFNCNSEDEVESLPSYCALNGTKWFIPTHVNTKRHEELFDMLFDFGFNVLILNGKNKEVRMQNGRKIQIDLKDDDLELSKRINRIYYETHLYNSPFAVIGNICIGRGVTFASNENGNEFVFTHGIIPPIGNGDEEYQMVARILGNIRHFNTIINHVPIIFLSPDTKERIEHNETFAINFSKKFYTEGKETTRITPEIMEEERRTNPPPKKSSSAKSKKIQEEKHLRVPFVIPLNIENEIENEIINNSDKFRKRKRIEKAEHAKNIIMNKLIADTQYYERYGEDTVDRFIEIINTKINHTTEYAISEDSYKKHISNVITHVDNKTPCSMLNINQKHKNYSQTCWEVFIDTREHRLCVLWQVYEE